MNTFLSLAVAVLSLNGACSVKTLPQADDGAARARPFPADLAVKDPIDYVNPLIGTASRRADTGNSAGMMPYVCPPFAAVEWVPMTRLSEVGILSFAAPDKTFLGFIGSRQPAIWMGEWGQLSVAPQMTAEPVCDYRRRGLEIDKAKCVYTPHYAKIVTKEGVVAELAGASHAAIMRFTWPEGAPKRLVFDASRVFLGRISCTNAFPGALMFTGGGKAQAWNDDFVDLNNSDPKSAPHVKYVIECSEPYAATGVYAGGARTGFRQQDPGAPIPEDAYPAIAQKPGETAVEGDLVGGWAEFPGAGRTLLVKIGSSMIDEATAQAHLDRELGTGFDFDKVVAETKAAWRRQLSVLTIDAPEDVKTIFYTAMYHASLYPRDISEGGRYRSPYDGMVHAGDMYTNYSMWDTYRAEHALLTFIAPHRVDGMMNALLNAYREGGWLPKWPNPGYSGQMVGGCAEMLLAEAYSKGFRGFDVNTAYAAVKKNATVPQVNDDEVRWADRQLWTGHNETRGGLANYMRLGYVAADVTAESVSRTQDFGLNDTAAAILADATGHAEDARMFRARMKNYTNLWDRAHQRFWPRNKDGRWATDLHLGWSMTIGSDYTEQSPETAIWGIPYDVPGLIALCGGRDAFERKLDDYFAKHFWTGRADGLSHHENETTHHISYLYAAAGFPEKAAKNIRRILTETYSAREWGMEGNEDCGQMSAWYILSALGFYPLNPATDEYFIGSPLVEKAVLTVGAPYRPTTFTILARNQQKANYVVKSVKLNGIELKERILRQRDIVAGGTLEFEMAPPETPLRANEVNPFIGTDANGHCNPGATRPFSMVQPGPDTGAGDWRYCAGYQYGDKAILGFSQNHLCGTGQGEMGDVLLLPFCGDEVLRRSSFSHANETATPGFYAVTLDAAKVRAELTSTERVACHRYTYLGEGPKRLLVDLQHGLVGESQWANRMTLEGHAAFAPDGRSMSGSRLVEQYWPRHRVFFHLVFNRPIAKKRLLKNEHASAKGEQWVLDFDLGKGEVLEAKVALSYRSVEGAKRNLETETPGWDFDGVRCASRRAWNDLLSRLEIDGATPDERGILATSIYHLCYQPNVISDVGERVRYSTFSFWDTYRAAHPLYTLLVPEQVNSFVDSILDHARQTGFMPIWEIYGLEGYDMIGAHSIPVVLDAWRKGFDVDLKAFYPHVKRTQTANNRALLARRTGKTFENCHWDLLDKYGYYPCDVVTWGNVSRLMETTLDDWCAAEMAKALGFKDDEVYFRARADMWRNVFRKESGWVSPRTSDGAWLMGYEPAWLIRPKDFKAGVSADTTEGSGYQWSFHVLHDLPGLEASMGGREAFASKLDFLFTHRPFWDGDKTLADVWPYRDVSGRIGEYSHGNETCHHVAYLASLVGDRGKTGARVREICASQYANRPDGVCGNDDCGQMSAWYVFAALGFYPVNPASAEYVLGEPLFPSARLRLANGKTLCIRRDETRTGVRHGGKPLTGPAIAHRDLLRGGELLFGSAGVAH